MLNRSITGAIAATMLLSTPVLAQRLPPAIVMVVDLDDVVAKSTAGQAATRELQARAETLRRRGADLQTQLQAEANAIRTGQSNNSLTGPALESRISAFEARQQAGEGEMERGQQDLQRSQAFVSQQIQVALKPIYAAILRERGLSILLPAGAVEQHTASLDASADVLARLNAALPNVSTTPPPPPAQAPAVPAQ